MAPAALFAADVSSALASRALFPFALAAGSIRHSLDTHIAPLILFVFANEKGRVWTPAPRSVLLRRIPVVDYV